MLYLVACLCACRDKSDEARPSVGSESTNWSAIAISVGDAGKEQSQVLTIDLGQNRSAEISVPAGTRGILVDGQKGSLLTIDVQAYSQHGLYAWRDAHEDLRVGLCKKGPVGSIAGCKDRLSVRWPSSIRWKRSSQEHVSTQPSALPLVAYSGETLGELSHSRWSALLPADEPKDSGSEERWIPALTLSSSWKDRKLRLQLAAGERSEEFEAGSCAIKCNRRGQWKARCGDKAAQTIHALVVSAPAPAISLAEESATAE